MQAAEPSPPTAAARRGGRNPSAKFGGAGISLGLRLAKATPCRWQNLRRPQPQPGEAAAIRPRNLAARALSLACGGRGQCLTGSITFAAHSCGPARRPQSVREVRRRGHFPWPAAGESNALQAAEPSPPSAAARRGGQAFFGSRNPSAKLGGAGISLGLRLAKATPCRRQNLRRPQPRPGEAAAIRPRNLAARALSLACGGQKQRLAGGRTFAVHSRGPARRPQSVREIWRRGHFPWPAAGESNALQTAEPSPPTAAARRGGRNPSAKFGGAGISLGLRRAKATPCRRQSLRRPQPRPGEAAAIRPRSSAARAFPLACGGRGQRLAGGRTFAAHSRGPARRRRAYPPSRLPEGDASQPLRRGGGSTTYLRRTRFGNI